MCVPSTNALNFVLYPVELIHKNAIPPFALPFARVSAGEMAATVTRAFAAGKLVRLALHVRPAFCLRRRRDVAHAMAVAHAARAARPLARGVWPVADALHFAGNDALRFGPIRLRLGLGHTN